MVFFLCGNRSVFKNPRMDNNVKDFYCPSLSTLTTKGAYVQERNSKLQLSYPSERGYRASAFPD